MCRRQNLCDLSGQKLWISKAQQNAILWSKNSELSFCVLISPFPSNRHHRSNDDCLEGKTENYQICSVHYCVQQLYTVNCTHIWTDLTVLWIGFCLTGPISLCLDSFLWSPYVIGQTIIFMVALCNRETIYIFMLWFVLPSSFFLLLLFFSSPNLSGRRSTILWHMMWP